MVSDLDIYRSAHTLIGPHGQDASPLAALCVDVLLERGDLDGYAVWGWIRRAVEELGRLRPTLGKRTDHAFSCAVNCERAQFGTNEQHGYRPTVSDWTGRSARLMGHQGHLRPVQAAGRYLSGNTSSPAARLQKADDPGTLVHLRIIAEPGWRYLAYRGVAMKYLILCYGAADCRTWDTTNRSFLLGDAPLSVEILSTPSINGLLFR